MLDVELRVLTLLSGGEGEVMERLLPAITNVMNIEISGFLPPCWGFFLFVVKCYFQGG